MVIPLKDLNPPTRRPIVTVLLIAANVLVFLLIQPRTDVAAENRFLLEHAAIPCEIVQGEPLTTAELQTRRCLDNEVPAAVIQSPQFFAQKNVYLAILTSMFLHASFLHLAFNMLFLWIFGNNLEGRFGPVGFTAFYVVCGILAMLVQVAVDTSSTAPVIGASGAIAGVMGAYLIYWPHARIYSLLFIFVIPLPASFVLLFWFGMQFLTASDSGVAWAAHVGGFVSGGVIAWLLGRIFGWHSMWRTGASGRPRPPASPPPFGRGGGGAFPPEWPPDPGGRWPPPVP